MVRIHVVNPSCECNNASADSKDIHWLAFFYAAIRIVNRKRETLIKDVKIPTKYDYFFKGSSLKSQ